MVTLVLLLTSEEQRLVPNGDFHVLRPPHVLQTPCVARLERAKTAQRAQDCALHYDGRWRKHQQLKN
jgi:hypothetical protein